jgi:cyclophilin family peptidyl-prolyl cis-trans isomerase
MWYKNSLFHRVQPGRWIMGGDIATNDGLGSVTVYGSSSMPAETNDLKFSEPYLLAASANDKGETGSQFFVTLQEIPALNGSKNTIFGRLLKGTRTLHQMEGYDEVQRVRI